MNSRLHNNDNHDKLKVKFKKRMDEIETMLTLTNKIKVYMKENKKKLLSQKCEDEKKIIQLQMANDPKLRDIVAFKRNQSLMRGTSFASSSMFVTENEDDDYTVPEEKDWKSEVKFLKKKIGDFNIANYVNILLPEE